MTSLKEIKTAIAQLDSHDRALLTAELFAATSEPEPTALEAALKRGLEDVSQGRMQSVEEVSTMIPKWISKS